MRYKMLLSLIEWIRETINAMKDEAHHDGRSTLEEKRSIATTVTKLDEAMMWLARYVSLRDERNRRESFFNLARSESRRESSIPGVAEGGGPLGY